MLATAVPPVTANARDLYLLGGYVFHIDEVYSEGKVVGSEAIRKLLRHRALSLRQQGFLLRLYNVYTVVNIQRQVKYVLMNV